MADDETLMRDRLAARPRPSSPSQLLRDLGKAGPATPEPDPAPPPTQAEGDSDTLPLPGDAYAAHSRINNKAEEMLSLLLRDWSIKTFDYGDLRFTDFQPGTQAGQSPSLVLRFIGVAEVRLEGRHLRRMVDPLRRRRLAWLAELTARRDFVDEDAVAITNIKIELLE